MRSRVLVAWLIVALIAAQAAGFRHAVAHAGRIDAAVAGFVSASPNSARASVDADRAWSSAIDHSCAAFDAVALGVAATTVVVAVDAARLVLSFVAEPASRGVPSPLALAYRSRAPPRLPTA